MPRGIPNKKKQAPKKAKAKDLNILDAAIAGLPPTTVPREYIISANINTLVGVVGVLTETLRVQATEEIRTEIKKTVQALGRLRDELVPEPPPPAKLETESGITVEEAPASLTPSIPGAPGIPS